MLSTRGYATQRRPAGPIDTAKALLVINRAIADGAVWIAVRGRELVGGIGFAETSQWYSDRVGWGLLWIWMNPDARSFSAARRLIETARIAAKARDMMIEFGIDNGVDVERKRKLYARLGLREIGAVFVGE